MNTTQSESRNKVGGFKDDEGKVRMSLVMDGFAGALRSVAEVATEGAKKYTDNGWVDVERGVERYTDAMYRHLNAEARGEVYGDEGLMHAAQAAWNALARLELILRERAAKYMVYPMPGNIIKCDDAPTMAQMAELARAAQRRK